MSVRINKITRGRFGNKIFQYNNVVQLANNLNVNASCVSWEGNTYFKHMVSYKSTNKKQKIIYWNEILDHSLNDLQKITENNDLVLDDPSYALHNTFYKVTKMDPRDFLQFKDKYIPTLDDNITYIGIHIRGGDILGGDGQDGREIHTPIYYKNAIDHVIHNIIKDKSYRFIVCTDDKQFASFKETITYLQQNNYTFSIGPNCGQHKFIDDFAMLSYCDILINSSSTFCCAAVFLGKTNKTVIHSKDWMNRIVKGDFSNQEYKKYVKKWTHKMTDDEWRNTKGYHKAKYFWINIFTKNVSYYDKCVYI